MKQASQTNIQIWCILAILVCFNLSGCDGRSSAVAEKRNSPYLPEFGEEDRVDTPQRSLNEVSSKINVSFIQPDDFLCLRLKPSRIVSNAEFKDVDWVALESRLSEIVGESNSKLSELESVWLTLDEGFFQNMTSGGSQMNGFGIVLDYASPFDNAELDEAIASADATSADEEEDATNDEDSESDFSGMKFVATRLSETRIALGTEEMEITPNPTPQLGMAEVIYQWNEDSEANAAMVIEPIRPMLVGLFDMVSRFSPEMKKVGQLPEVVKDLSIAIELDDSKETSLLSGRILIDDAEVATELIKMMNSAGANRGTQSPFGMMGNGMRTGGNEDSLMFEPVSQKAFTELAREIKDDNLFRFSQSENEISFDLKRPSSLTDTIKAAVSDANRQAEIAGRYARGNEIAEALKAYVKKHGQLPHAGTVLDSDASPNQPAQFNWRVALLPMLGLQEQYDAFDFNKPWNDEANLAVAKDIPDVFNASSHSTIWRPIISDRSLFRSDRLSPKIDDIKDRKIWTAVFAEVAPEENVNWIQPVTTELSTKSMGLTDENGILILNGQFQVRIVKNEPETVSKVVTSEGDERMTSDDFIKIQ